MNGRKNQTRIEQIEKKWRIENELKEEQEKLMVRHYGQMIFC